MKKEFVNIVTILFISISNISYAQNWIFFTDTISDKMAISYSYPRNMMITYKGHLIGFWHVFTEKQRDPMFPPKNIKWSIAFFHSDSVTQEQIISNYQKRFMDYSTIEIIKDEINLTNLQGINVTKYDIYNSRPKTVFLFFEYEDMLIRLWGSDEKKFRKFYKSIKLIELKNAP